MHIFLFLLALLLSAGTPHAEPAKPTGITAEEAYRRSSELKSDQSQQQIAIIDKMIIEAADEGRTVINMPTIPPNLRTGIIDHYKRQGFRYQSGHGLRFSMPDTLHWNKQP